MGVNSRYYLVACPHCGWHVSALPVHDIDPRSGSIRELATCPRCRTVLSAEIPPVRSRLLEYIRQVEETVAALNRRQDMFLRNQQRRILDLKDLVESGRATLEERTRYSKALEALSDAEPQDVTYLQEKLELAQKALGKASDGPFLHTCGEEMVIHEDSPKGYRIECPLCGEWAVIRLTDNRGLED
ncbi:MAG: hypothetical protein JW909_12050 [Planctomycetes bacterium]|nr:hypothetical protein [Planctomycetota bacterium]